ncbi:hypothetical protein GCM10027053_05670 [Intrasporangium mesophilum]
MDSTVDARTTDSVDGPPPAGPEALGLEVGSAVGLAETAEAEFMWAMHEGAPDEAKQVLGMASRRVGGGVALVMRHDPTGGFWNKALGFGVTEPVTAELVAELADFYRSGGAPAMVLQIAPSALPADWDETCARHGIAAGNVWVKLLRPAEPALPEGQTDLHVDVVDRTSAADYARVFARGFEMPEEPHLLAMFGAVVTSGLGFTAYGAWDGDRLVSAAQLHVAGPAAAFCGAATLPDARGRGAQSAFMERRVADSRAAGCAWMSAETWQEADGAHNPSLHNMRRAGFVDIYDRRNWVWRNET